LKHPNEIKKILMFCELIVKDDPQNLAICATAATASAATGKLPPRLEGPSASVCDM
jgi:hypothetical protein